MLHKLEGYGLTEGSGTIADAMLARKRNISPWTFPKDRHQA